MNFHKRLAVALSAFAICAAPMQAEDLAQISNPMTVRAGEELRITLFNPDDKPVSVKVFAYNAVENNYDEGPLIVLPPGRLRFFDFKLNREFVGFTGVIEIVPDGGNGANAAKEALPKQILAVTHTFRSRSSVQHRTANGQSQTLGWSWGGMAGGAFGVARPTGIPASAVKPSRSVWEASPE